jgi:predicted AlkP superfamily pyrophosphatase or phosphodiesterase
MKHCLNKQRKLITIILLIGINLYVYPQKKKTLLIGIDGLQFEKIAETATPNFDRFYIKKGYTGGEFGTDTQQKTSSGPSWMTILTGVWNDKHGIEDNTKDKLCESPSIFKMLKKHNGNFYVSSVSTWKNINIFLKDDMYHTNFSAQGGNDVLSTELTIDQITDYDADFSFVHLDDIDHAGHTYGFGSAYDTAIKRIDDLIGRMLDVVEQREHKYHEDWLVILVTDHGRDARGFHHGAQKINQKTIFVGLNKHGNAKFTQNNNQKPINSFKDLETLIPLTSVIPTILTHFNVPIKKEWRLESQSLID